MVKVNPGSSFEKSPRHTTTWYKFWQHFKALNTLITGCMFQKIALPSDFMHIFSWFLHVQSPWAGAGAVNPLEQKFWCQQEGLITIVICWKFKKNLQPLTLYTSFHNLINVYSRRSGADNPRGQILMSTETSCNFGHLLQVSKKSLWSLTLHNFFLSWFYTCI